MILPLNSRTGTGFYDVARLTVCPGEVLGRLLLAPASLARQGIP